MWSELNFEQMAAAENGCRGRYSADETEAIVIMERLDLYNYALPCGPKALRQRLEKHYMLQPLPSERTIGRILSRNGLTHGRTGWYEGDHRTMES